MLFKSRQIALEFQRMAIFFEKNFSRASCKFSIHLTIMSVKVFTRSTYISSLRQWQNRDHKLRHTNPIICKGLRMVKKNMNIMLYNRKIIECSLKKKDGFNFSQSKYSENFPYIGIFENITLPVIRLFQTERVRYFFAFIFWIF